MLPAFPASVDAHGNLLVQSRVGLADGADWRLRPALHVSSDPPAPGAPGAAAADSNLEIAAWAAFARGLGLARDSVYDVIRAIGLDPSVAHAVADQVTEVGKVKAGAQALAAAAPTGAQQTLAFQGVSVAFSGAGGRFALKVEDVSVKASTGGDGTHFGEAKVTVKAAAESLTVNAEGGQLQARFAELGTSLDATVSVTSLAAGGAAPGAPGTADTGLGVAGSADGSQSGLAGGTVTGLSFDLTVPLTAGGGLSLVAGGHPVNVTA